MYLLNSLPSLSKIVDNDILDIFLTKVLYLTF